ncbi:Uma2 family endonuclease [Streptomyces sp. NPDC090052]|uniref:Uma2 family endonuclease n=1 Tax=unclassified Streptomyces TaxID=2593676 RepID=UPI00225369C9|nr:Uma2 family endonuclease [Streptomyces sp. NBC_01306]MCX4726264.1 Uma2 family endonuclease [Streptomyces sp. NBC_01306]WSX42468.1 Uma2 family endonuclease [Streptomyces sp. NBC_00963]WSX69487.1 Uma2 family endonuclease [Streptomyces sp. NBC_00932]
MAGQVHPSIPVRRGHLREAAESIEQATGMRVEIIGGTLVMPPSPSGKRAGIVIDLRDAIRPGLAAVNEAFENVSVPMADDPDDYATPDLTIGPRAFKDADEWLLDADAVELAVEVISPSERLKGINEKTAWYAAAGVARLLQIDPRTGTWSLFTRPRADTYQGGVHGLYGEPVPLPAELGGDLGTGGLSRYGPR